MTVRSYLLSLPERVVRSALGLGAGVAREAGEVALPPGVRRSRLYQNLVDAMLRYMIEQVGGVEGVYGAEGRLPDGFLARRTAGNAVEILGVLAFRASPVWVLAALADLCGMGRQLIPEIADALKTEGLLEKKAQFTSVDQILDGLERTSARLASTINAPPLDVPGLRKEWDAIREESRGLRPGRLPSRDTIRDVWSRLAAEAARQNRSVFETSSIMAVSAVRSLPGGVRWLSSSTRVGARRSGQVFAGALLEHYRHTLGDMRRVGYVAYAGRQLGPYVRAAAGQFSRQRPTLTQRLLDRLRSSRSRFGPTPQGGPSMAASTQWQLAREAAERYERILVPSILGPAARALVERSAPEPGETVLDVGCGTGAAARIAAQYVGSSGRIIGIDVNPGMIDVARSLPPTSGADIEWYEKSVYELPVADRTVDLVLCAQTLQFLDERRSALSEVRRVLRPGGRVAISLWCDIRENPYFDTLIDAIARHIGRETAAGLKAAFTLTNAEEIHALLLEAGFEDIELTIESLAVEVPPLRDFVPLYVSATPMVTGFNAAAEAARRAVIEEVSVRLARYETVGGARVPFRTHLAMARAGPLNRAL